MKPEKSRIAEIFALSALAVLAIAASAWAGPPAPPVIADAPTVPLGGPEISIATAVGIAAYGTWKGRR